MKEHEIIFGHCSNYPKNPVINHLEVGLYINGERGKKFNTYTKPFLIELGFANPPKKFIFMVFADCEQDAVKTIMEMNLYLVKSMEILDVTMYFSKNLHDLNEEPEVVEKPKPAPKPKKPRSYQDKIYSGYKIMYNPNNANYWFKYQVYDRGAPRWLTFASTSRLEVVNKIDSFRGGGDNGK